MTMNKDGLFQYNHVLIFYERFTQEIINEDFNVHAYIEKLARSQESHLLTSRVLQDAALEKTVGFGQKALLNRA